MICKFIVFLFFCCTLSTFAKANEFYAPVKHITTDTLLLNSHRPKINAELLNKPKPAPVVHKAAAYSSYHSAVNNHKIYPLKSRREGPAEVAEKVRQVQIKVNKIEARIREIELAGH